MSKSKNWIFRIAATFLPILLLVLTPALGIWMGVVREGRVASLIESSLQDEVIRKNLSVEIADSLISGMDEKTQKEAEPSRAELEVAIGTRLEDPVVQFKLSSIASEVFTSISTGAESVSIDPTPVIDELVTAINSVAGLDKVSREDIGEIEPIKIGTSEEPLPNIGPILGILRLVALLTFLLALLSGAAIIRISKTPLRGLSIPLLVIGSIWTLIYFVGLNIMKSQLEPGIQSEVAPRIASEVLSGFRSLSLFLLICGVALLIAHFVIKRRKLEMLESTA